MGFMSICNFMIERFDLKAILIASAASSLIRLSRKLKLWIFDDGSLRILQSLPFSFGSVSSIPFLEKSRSRRGQVWFYDRFSRTPSKRHKRPVSSNWFDERESLLNLIFLLKLLPRIEAPIFPKLQSFNSKTSRDRLTLMNYSNATANVVVDYSSLKLRSFLDKSNFTKVWFPFSAIKNFKSPSFVILFEDKSSVII